jgi:hypothetical protein
MDMSHHGVNMTCCMLSGLLRAHVAEKRSSRQVFHYHVTAASAMFGCLTGIQWLRPGPCGGDGHWPGVAVQSCTAVIQRCALLL